LARDDAGTVDTTGAEPFADDGRLRAPAGREVPLCGAVTKTKIRRVV
jgi:hypothetical protein